MSSGVLHLGVEVESNWSCGAGHRYDSVGTGITLCVVHSKKSSG